MKIESHEEKLRESIEVIKESIRIGILERQRTIGFNASAAAIDMLEIILHETKHISPGFIIKHEWFNSKNKIKDKFGFDFPGKNKLIHLISKIESERNKLCYGRPRNKTEIQEVLDVFNKLKKEFEYIRQRVN
ncbi:MAG: hypothetical protein KKA65_03310 [Nanoarchaeota archaeon]|nr:hypothetical protein [Nanoarchaeota archaeon]MBU4352023.1 hypothetical protein [Nanoarchaeota archaeon]MBU4456506.1 hypothetical protein [Nanoarchaeota archaeon]MCG2719318.1 hypothetical protein [Nanoarchaeota archaeon]